MTDASPYPPRPKPRAFRDPSLIRADLAADLRGAAGRGELVAYFQPIIDLASGRIVAAEALCRWRHPGIGLVAPRVFIEIAERSDVIHEVGAFMLDAGCAFLDDADRAEHGIGVSVNVSPAQLTTPGVWAHLEGQLRSRSLDPARVTVEVTESLEISDPAAVASILAEMKDHGVGISLDDFGSGHTSPALLTQLPVTEVKLDRSLIQGAADDAGERVREALEIAKRLEIRVVAEGVETAEQRDYVIGLGCHRAQGYLLGRAMPLARFDAFVKAHRTTGGAV